MSQNGVRDDVVCTICHYDMINDWKGNTLIMNSAY